MNEADSYRKYMWIVGTAAAPEYRGSGRSKREEKKFSRYTIVGKYCGGG